MIYVNIYLEDRIMSDSDINFTIDKRIDFIHALVCSDVIKNNF